MCLDWILASVLWLNFGDVGLATFERNFDVDMGTSSGRASSKAEGTIHKEHSSYCAGPNGEPQVTLTAVKPTDKDCATQQTNTRDAKICIHILKRCYLKCVHIFWHPLYILYVVSL